MGDGVLRSTGELAAIAERIIAPTALGNFPRPSNAVLLSAPFAFGVDASDLLRVRAWCHAPRSWPSLDRLFVLTLRMVRADGTGQVSDLTIAPTTNVVAQTFYLTLEAGAIQTVALYWDGPTLTTQSGRMYAIVDLLRGTPTGAQKVIGTFIAGYVGAGEPITWPGSPLLAPNEGPGYPQLLPFSSTAGNEMNITGLTNVLCKLRSIDMEFTAGPAAGNRRPHVFFTIGVNDTGQFPSAEEIAPGTIVRTQFSPGNPLSVGRAGYSGVAPIPSDVVLRGPDRIKTLTLGFTAADRFSKFDVLWDTWIEPLP